ncbi:MAG: hypothetical protein HKL92_08935 [Candidatus Eremiobacteraeota bacterium]|nr:hypothetical protein [Candidatus Eremiobacteraeota bacterium]
MPQQSTTLSALLREAFGRLRDRLGVTLGATAIACAIGLGIARSPMQPLVAESAAQLIALPLIASFIYLWVTDLPDGSPRPLKNALERLLERSWAVLMIDLALSLIQALTTAPSMILWDLLLVPLLAATIYADVSATLDSDIPTIALLPHAAARTLSLAMHARNFGRMCLLLAAQFGLQAILLEIAVILPHGLRAAGTLVLAILAQVVLAAVTARMFVEASTPHP